MNKIVKDHFPVSELPEALRADLDPAGHVRVTIEPEARSDFIASFADPKDFESWVAVIRSLPEATDDPVERVRALRDEWDD